MNYKLINNLTTENNHSTRLKELFNNCDNVILVSPFLMTDFSDFLEEISLSVITKIHLITTLKPKSFDQIRKISSLISLIDHPEIKSEKIKYQISLNNKLHGKIYIFKKNNKYISAIITSANFTESGLVRNHEWGIEITDKDKISEVENSIMNSIEYENLSSKDILSMQEKANDYLAKHPKKEEREIELNLTDSLNSSIWTNELDNTIEYWLKPIGVSDSPIVEGTLFNELETRLHFSKQRPNGVKPNDILISYGVGTSKIISVYRVLSFPEYVTDEEIENEDWLERWPWYVRGENLTQNFGTDWWKHHLHINPLKDKYLSVNPNAPITAVGGKTLGALNFGKDKLKLSPDFARFIIEIVVRINNNGSR
ncbi:restriction endonuclease PLD domain-containing protein [Saccharicrinis sp. FJH2]|uniref:restriction endonuclease PLD domain-containing protein n=1 Tax=Saccharicrinis sp. FJH65 TaxID=3344659 RepID=UPI0035F44317